MTSKWKSWSRGTNSRFPFGVKVKHNLSIAIPFSHVVRRDAFGYLGKDGQSFEFSIFFFLILSSTAFTARRISYMNFVYAVVRASERVYGRS